MRLVDTIYAWWTPARVASAALAIVLGAVVTLLVRRALARMPADTFVRPPERRNLALRAARAIAGSLLVAAGVAMLFLPGPGIATIVVGLLLLDLPVNRRLAVTLLRRPALAAWVERLRRDAGSPPLELPDDATPPA